MARVLAAVLMAFAFLQARALTEDSEEDRPQGAPVSTRGDDAHDEVAAGDQSAQLSLRVSSRRNQSAATPLGQVQSDSGCQSIGHWDIRTVCNCVDSVYVDKCKSCMCGIDSTRWCNTACDPTGDDPDNSCCQPFKQTGETCGQTWECGPAYVIHQNPLKQEGWYETVTDTPCKWAMEVGGWMRRCDRY
jgi:hypothetical protein